jgi:hypothetical protein
MYPLREGLLLWCDRVAHRSRNTRENLTTHEEARWVANHADAADAADATASASPVVSIIQLYRLEILSFRSDDVNQLEISSGAPCLVSTFVNITKQCREGVELGIVTSHVEPRLSLSQHDLVQGRLLT